jgi:hypothetical protein
MASQIIGSQIAGTVPDATGMAWQQHLCWGVNDAAWWLFYYPNTDTTHVLTYRSPDGITWTAKTASGALAIRSGTTSNQSQGRNLGVQYRNISSTDVFHLVCYTTTTTGTLDDTQHARAHTSAAAITWDNAWALNDTAAGPTHDAATFPSGATTVLDSGNRPYDLGNHDGTIDGNPLFFKGTNTDAGSSWTAGFGASAQIEPVSSSINAIVGFDIGSTNLLALWEDASVAETTSMENVRWSKYTGTWSTPASIFTILGAGIDPNNFGACAIGTTEVHCVLRTGSNTYTHKRFNGTNWTTLSGATIPTQTSLAGAGIAMSSNGTDVWLGVIDSAAGNAVKYIKWTASTGLWDASWTTLDGTSQTRNYLSFSPNQDATASKNIGVIWSQTNGSNFDIVFATMPTIVGGGTTTEASQGGLVAGGSAPPKAIFPPQLAGLLLDIPASASPLVLQSATGAAASATSNSVTFPSINTVGDLLVLATGNDGGGPVVSTVTDTLGNAWTRATGQIFQFASKNLELWYVASCLQGLNKVTVTYTASCDSGVVIAEYSSSSPLALDQIATAATPDGVPNQSIWTGSTPSTTQAQEIVVAAVYPSTATNQAVTATSPFTLRNSVAAGPFGRVALADQLVTSIGQYGAGFTPAVADQWGAVLVTFRSGPGTTTEGSQGGLVAGAVTTPGVTFPEAAQGGLVAGGVAGPSITFPDQGAQGGLVAGAATTPGASFTEAAQGGLVAGGVATPSVTFVQASQGGLIAGSVVAFGVTFTQSAQGGLVAGAVTTPGATFTEAAQGGLVAGCTTGGSITSGTNSQGGLVAGGITTPAVVFPPQGAQGGLVAGSQAAPTITYVQSAQGGLIAGTTTAVNVTFTEAAAGGLVAGGTTQAISPTGQGAQGGLIAGGFSSFGVTFSPTSQGGLVAGTTTTAIQVVSEGSQGGLVAGGSAPPVVVYSLLSGGGVVAGGWTIAFSGLNVVGAQGGLVAGGATGAVVTYVSLPQVPVGVMFGGALLARGPLLMSPLLGTPPLDLFGPPNVLPRPLHTFDARTFAGLGTFLPGTFSGYGLAIVGQYAHPVDGWHGTDSGVVWIGMDGGASWHGNDGGTIWAGVQDMPIAGTLEKITVDNRLYAFDFSGWAEMQRGLTLTSAVITVAPTGLTIGVPVIVPQANQIQVRISDGAADTTYLIQCKATTSGGDTISQKGNLAVIADP